MSLPQHHIDVILPSGDRTACRMSARVDLAEQTGLFKTAVFEAAGGRELVAGKRLGEWSEIESIDNRPAIDVAREVLGIEASSEPHP